MSALPWVTMHSMTEQIYNMVTTAASAISMNPLMIIELVAATLAIVTGLAGRLAILFEDLRYTRLSARNR
jgi:hypothetical protein